MLSLLFIIITLLYFALIMSFVYGFDKVKAFEVKNTEQVTRFSIVIPFRNEADNLLELLQSLTSLNYDKEKYEIILVDDDSKDDSVKVIEKVLDTISSTFEITRTDIKIIQNIRNTNSPKKDAITAAIAIAKYEWIVTTDADCIVPESWLKSFNVFIQHESPEMVVAPVTYHKIDSFLQCFQLLDFLSLMGATIGGFGIKKPFLCNGANLAYKRELFKTINGFDDNANIASGDDIFMMEKTLKANKKISYLKSEDAIVKTLAQPTWKTLFEQRKRWAAKTSQYQSNFAKSTGLLVLFMNTTIIVSLFLSLSGLLDWFITLTIFLLKSALDFLLLYKTSQFFNQQRFLSSFFVSALIYPFFSIYIAFTSLFTNYKWKGRAFNK